MSEYTNIKSAKQLIQMVQMHGLSTLEEDICAAQDIFGHEAESTLEELANMPEYRSEFYFILYHIWHWEDATRFYNEHTNPVFKNLKKAKEELEDELNTLESEKNAEIVGLEAENKALAESLEIAKKNATFLNDENFKKAMMIKELEQAIKEKDLEIITLKAKLYDIIHGNA